MLGGNDFLQSGFEKFVDFDELGVLLDGLLQLGLQIVVEVLDLLDLAQLLSELLPLLGVHCPLFDESLQFCVLGLVLLHDLEQLLIIFLKLGDHLIVDLHFLDERGLVIERGFDLVAQLAVFFGEKLVVF